jgi:aryl-alcohol dehydrogenase-like predicted oxidoreductase
MEYRRLGNSGLRISELSLGTMTFGTSGSSQAVLGSTTIADARRQVDIALDAGVNLIDTADVYADGASEQVVGEVIRGRRERLLVATKARFATGPGPNDAGLSRHHLLEACDASLQRLGVDHNDL